MLKRSIMALLCLLLLCSLAACATNDVEASASAEEAAAEAGFRRTVLYYPTEEGFIVPVMKLIPWEEGIGMAALSYLEGSEDNRLSASQMGLTTVLPEDSQYTLRIFDDGTARVDFEKFPENADAEAERRMVVSVVNTLTEFPAIEQVEFSERGKVLSALPCGTALSGAQGAFALNAEGTEAMVSAGDSNALKLYFATSSGSLNVPVTRYTALAPDAAACVSELISGPKSAGLLACFPKGTQLLSASVENNIATVNLSQEFLAVEESDGMAAAAYDTMLLTLMEAVDAYALDVQVEGEPYAIEGSALSVPVFCNSFR